MPEDPLAVAADDSATPTDAENGKVKAIEPPLEPEFDFIPPDDVRIFTDATGKTRMAVGDKCAHLDVKIARCFPQSEPDGYWVVSYRDDRVIGVIVDPEDLDRESLEAASARLDQQYFMPRITAVLSLKEEFGAVYFEVETDRGSRSFVTKGVREAAQEELDDGEILITDVNENRYSIPDWQSMDPRSRRLLERIV